MDSNDNKDFIYQQQRALERMREMNQRSQFNVTDTHKMPPVPDFIRVQKNAGESRKNNIANEQINTSDNNNGQNTKNNANNKKVLHSSSGSNNNGNNNNGNSNSFGLNSLLGGLNLPFLDVLKSDSDISLILGILLILLSESGDRKLLIALLYILM